MVMIESLACGTPVVVTPQGAANEIVDDGITGFVRSTAAGLAHGLQYAPALDRSACRAAITERFTPERLVAEHVACYREAIARTWSSDPARDGAVLVA